MGIAHDITQRKTIEDQLADARDELESQVEARTAGLAAMTAELVETNRKLREEINEHNRAEEALRKEKNYSQSIIRSMADMLVVISPDGAIATVNQAACNLLGYPEHELIGQPAKLLFEEDEDDEEEEDEEEDEDNPGPILSRYCLPVKRTVLCKLVKEGEVKNLEKALRTKRGETIPAALSGAVMRDDRGAIRGIVCIAQDLTEMKKSQRALQQAAWAQFDAEKQAATGRLAALVAHEINNPLAGIKNAFRIFDRRRPQGLPGIRLRLAHRGRSGSRGADRVPDVRIAPAGAGQDGGSRSGVRVRRMRVRCWNRFCDRRT